MSTGSRMKERRKALHISAETVADKLGVSPATIYRYEKGDIEKVPTTILEPLSKILQTTPEYLMGWSSRHEIPMSQKAVEMVNEHIEKRKHEELIKLYENAEPVYQEIVMDILKSHQRK